MGHARLPFFYRLSLVFLSTQIVHSWAAPIPNYTFTLFGVPITIYTGNNGAGGANAITTSTSPIRTQATTTTTQRTALGTTTTTTSPHTAPDSTPTAQQAPTTSAATPTTATPTTATPTTATLTTVPQIVAAGSSAAAHLSDTTSEHNAPAASSITTVPAVVPSLRTDLSTDAAGSAPGLSSMASEPAAASPSSTDIISVSSSSSSSSNKSALVANILIPLVIFFVLLAAGLLYKRRRARAKKHAAEIDGHVVPYMLEFSSSDGDAWTRFDGTPPPAQLAVPERALGTSAAPVGAYSISSTAPTLSYSVPRTDDWSSALAHWTTDDRQSMVSDSALAYMTAGDRHSVVSDASYYQETSSGADVLRPSGDTRSSPSPVASDSDESRSMPLSDAYSSRHLTADHPTPPPLYHYRLRQVSR